MEVDGINEWTPSWKAGGFPCVRTRFSLNVENEEADVKRYGRTRVAFFPIPG